MKWINVRDKPLPREHGVFLALWKGAICLAEWDQEEDRFYISMLPAQYLSSMKVEQERECKFTHWQPLSLPEDY